MASNSELLAGAEALLGAVDDGSAAFTTGFRASVAGWLREYRRSKEYPSVMGLLADARARAASQEERHSDEPCPFCGNAK